MKKLLENRVVVLVTLIVLASGVVASLGWSADARSKRVGAVENVDQTPVFEAKADRELTKGARSRNSQYVVTQLEDQGTIDLGKLGIVPTKQPMPHVSRADSSSVGTNKAFFGTSHEIVNQSTTNAFGTLGTDFTPGENVDFYLNGSLSTTFVANATGGYVAVGINTGAGFGYLTIDLIGQTSGKEAGGVVQVSATGPYGPGVVAGPHSINNTSSPFLLMYGWGYPVNLTNGINLYRNGTAIGTASTSAAGRYFISVGAANIPTSPDSAAVYGGDRTGIAGSYAGATVEERADAGTAPAGDQNSQRAFVDRAYFNSAAAATFALVGEGFAANETVTLSGCASSPLTADANGSVGAFLTAPAGVATYTCVLTGQSAGRVARAAVVGNANATTFRGMIVQPSLIDPSVGTVKVLATKFAASDTGQVFLDGVAQGAGITNASGYGTAVIPKPTTISLHAVSWVASNGDPLATVLQLAPGVVTASSVAVSGRILTSDGRGLRNAMVAITDPQGNSRQVMTGPFGSYSFTDVESGQNYVISIMSRRFTYQPRVVQVVDNISDMDFYPAP